MTNSPTNSSTSATPGSAATETTLASYRTIIFDCDGVILDSNPIKTEAFREVASTIDPELAETLVEFHVANGGISRFRKFEYFIERCHEQGLQTPPNDALCRHFAELVRTRLLRCPVAQGLSELRETLPNTNWMIASGADQVELREVFRVRKLDKFFDAGMYGSPDSKHCILARELEAERIRRPALFLGDSRLDHQVATANDLDFVFVSEWTDFEDWEAYTRDHSVETIETISALLGHPHECECPGPIQPKEISKVP